MKQILRLTTTLIVLLFLGGSAWGQTIVSYDFSDVGAVDGLNEASPGITLDANIGFGSFKNSAANPPAIFSGQLRLYQNATKGGSIKIYASNGVTITQVIVNASGTTGPAAYSVDGVGSTTVSHSSGTYTMSGLTGTNNVEFWCTGSSSGTRIYVNNFVVTYTSEAPPPTITVNPSSLSDFTYVIGNGPSTSKSFDVSGLNLTNDITIAPTTNYEISLDNSSFQLTDIILTETDGSVSSTTIHVRLRSGLSISTYNNENITATSIPAENKTITCSGSVTAPLPTIAITGTLNDFGSQLINTTSAEQTYSVSGANLTEDITITPPVGFEVSKTTITGFVSSPSSLTLVQSNGIVGSTTIYVRFAPTVGQSYTGNIAHTSSGAVTQNVAVSGTGFDPNVPLVVISQAYGGGGNSNSIYKNDFIELFNRGNTSVSLDGWSVQYASATGSSWSVTPLSNKILAPGQYYLIQEAAGSGGTTYLPTPDDIGTIAMGATNFKLALVNNSTALTESCPTGANIIDFVGAGSANCSEGTGSTPTPSNTNAVIRDSDGCTDENNNSTDFTVGVPTPRNTASPFNICAPATSTYTNVGDWSEIANWSDGLPGATTNAIIEGTVTVDDLVECKDLTISPLGAVTVGSGQGLIVYGNFLIESDASGTGSFIGAAEDFTIDGTTTIQRYLSGGWSDWDAGWHQISSPVASQPIVDFVTAGDGNGYDFYGWDESTNMWMNYKAAGFEAWNDNSTNFNVGQGYLVSYESQNITQTFTGELNSDDVTLENISKGGNGWHLLGNPYASALVWNDENNWILDNVAGNAKIWHETNKSYSDIAPNGIIPSAQGFMVQVSDAANGILFYATARTHDTQPFYKAGNEQLLLVAAETEGGSAQESKIIINSMATEGFDFEYDSRFLAGYAPMLYSVVGDEMLSTNSLPELSSEMVIPFGFVKNAATNFTIELNLFNSQTQICTANSC